MAITGLLIHTLKNNVTDVEAKVKAMPDMTTYGIHEDQYVVVVAEVPSDQLEKAVGKIDEIDGVLTVYTTYLTIEDEIDEHGNLQTNISPKDLFKKSSRSKSN